MISIRFFLAFLFLFAFYTSIKALSTRICVGDVFKDVGSSTLPRTRAVLILRVPWMANRGRTLLHTQTRFGEARDELVDPSSLPAARIVPADKIRLTIMDVTYSPSRELPSDCTGRALPNSSPDLEKLTSLDDELSPQANNNFNIMKNAVIVELSRPFIQDRIFGVAIGSDVQPSDVLIELFHIPSLARAIEFVFFEHAAMALKEQSFDLPDTLSCSRNQCVVLNISPAIRGQVYSADDTMIGRIDATGTKLAVLREANESISQVQGYAQVIEFESDLDINIEIETLLLLASTKKIPSPWTSNTSLVLLDAICYTNSPTSPDVGVVACGHVAFSDESTLTRVPPQFASDGTITQITKFDFPKSFVEIVLPLFVRLMPRESARKLSIEELGVEIDENSSLMVFINGVVLSNPVATDNSSRAVRFVQVAAVADYNPNNGLIELMMSRNENEHQLLVSMQIVVFKPSVWMSSATTMPPKTSSTIAATTPPTKSILTTTPLILPSQQPSSTFSMSSSSLTNNVNSTSSVRDQFLIGAPNEESDSSSFLLSISIGAGLICCGLVVLLAVLFTKKNKKRDSPSSPPVIVDTPTNNDNNDSLSDQNYQSFKSSSSGFVNYEYGLLPHTSNKDEYEFGNI